MMNPANIIEDNMVAAELKISTKPLSSYRVKKIEVKRSDAIDQIKMTYDDGTVWSCGHDGGTMDKRALVMTDKEYLVRVTHERFLNYKCAGAAIEFETNKGRVFAYHPTTMATKWKTEETTIKALPGKEIICLTIRRGVLVGLEQQTVPIADVGEYPKQWYVIVSHRQKEDAYIDESNSEDDMNCKEFDSKSNALEEWNKVRTEVYTKQGRGAILVDCRTGKVLNKAGSYESIKSCTTKAMDKGFHFPNKEEDVSILDVIFKLFYILSEKKDICTFFTVSTLLFMSFYLNLEGQLLTGKVLTMVISNQTELKSNWYARFSCKYIIECNGSNMDFSKAIIIAFILLKVVEELLYISNEYLNHSAGEMKSHRLQLKAFNHVLSLDQTYFDTHSTSDIRGSMNVRTLSDLITWDVPHIVTLTIRLLMVAYYLVSINLYLGSITVACIIAFKVFILDPIQRLQRQIHRVHLKLKIMNYQIKDDVLNMIASIKMFSKERYHIGEYEAAQQRVMKMVNMVAILRCIRIFCYGVIKVMLFGGLLYYGLEIFKDSNLTAGDLTAFFLLLQQFQDLFGRIKMHCEFLIRDFPDIDRFMTLMEAESTIVDGSNKLAEVQGEIEFENVHFAYPSRPGEEVLKGLTLRIQPQKMTAIVGDSGAGKSTITKLLMRLYDPQIGTVKIDGHDLRSLNTEDIHEKIAIVNQNPDLFSSSLADNIGYGATGTTYSEKQVKTAADLSNCTFISKFRAGFDTFVGSGGSQLSGGQKQRIAIARAAIRDPKILILDEATSSLDAENEQLVQAALENIMKERTILVIAHRLSTVKNADEIICMKNGEVVERGTHNELMLMGRVYHNLVSKQIVEEQYQKAKRQSIVSDCHQE